jgi:predicted transcriptional regulator
MRVVWDRQRVTVRAVYEELRLGRRTTYSTVMTTMNNLVRKGLARQDTGGEAFIYTPAVSDVDVATAVLDVVVEAVMGGCAGPLIDYLQAHGARCEPNSRAT